MIQDYGFRLYNPAIGKFLSFDPLAPDYPELTPYQFASNSPIINIDLDGLEGHNINSEYSGFSAEKNRSRLDNKQKEIKYRPEFEFKFGWGLSIGAEAKVGPAVVGLSGTYNLDYVGYNSSDGAITGRTSGVSANVLIFGGGIESTTLLPKDATKPNGVSVDKYKSYYGLFNGRGVFSVNNETTTTQEEIYTATFFRSPANTAASQLGHMNNTNNDYFENRSLVGEKKVSSSQDAEFDYGFSISPIFFTMQVGVKMKGNINQQGSNHTTQEVISNPAPYNDNGTIYKSGGYTPYEDAMILD